ncbi:MAG: VapC toxin family PIN domain ribonuclease [Hyphomicrobiales bacterium]|nr:MAG: VapC toxin family PIN domain ribonuclease [Hyphomicrobiales bacterium]
MIVLDTNVISEMLRPAPNASVATWLAAQPPASIFTTAITQAEINYGLLLLPNGKRRTELGEAILPIFAEDFEGRVLSFDPQSAGVYASVAVARRRAGMPISQFDAQIAAIALSRGAAIATRNVADFAGIGLTVVDPWQFAA